MMNRWEQDLCGDGRQVQCPCRLVLFVHCSLVYSSLAPVKSNCGPESTRTVNVSDNTARMSRGKTLILSEQLEKETLFVLSTLHS